MGMDSSPPREWTPRGAAPARADFDSPGPNGHAADAAPARAAAGDALNGEGAALDGLKALAARDATNGAGGPGTASQRSSFYEDARSSDDAADAAAAASVRTAADVEVELREAMRRQDRAAIRALMDERKALSPKKDPPADAPVR